MFYFLDCSLSTPAPSIAPGKTAQKTTENAQAVGFSVAIVILSVIGVLLLIIVIVVAIVRKPKNNREVILKGNESIMYTRQ